MGRGKNQSKVRQGRDLEKWRSNRPQAPEGCIRVIGGRFRGQTLLYSGDRVTRPMKDNVREALFNLVGGYLESTIAFDLFAGTGAVGLEALSRYAQHAILIERHVPTSKIIRQNVESLGVAAQTTIDCSDTFFWARQFFKNLKNQQDVCPGLDSENLNQYPWAVFCCPPYDLFVDKQQDLMVLIENFQKLCPAESLIVVESDSRFDPELLPDDENWDSRQYSPAVISVWKNNQPSDSADAPDSSPNDFPN